MKNFLASIFGIALSVSATAADYPTPPAGFAYETDLRPHSLVVTNLDNVVKKNESITIKELTGYSRAEITPDSFTLWYEPEGFYKSFMMLKSGEILFSDNKEGNYITRALKFPENMSYQETIAILRDVDAVKAEIPKIATNVVRDIQGLVYDEKLNITWKQTMYDGNLYYIAVTNANITEVK
jgi:hypothetical protein